MKEHEMPGIKTFIDNNKNEKHAKKNCTTQKTLPCDTSRNPYFSPIILQYNQIEGRYFHWHRRI